MRHLLKFLFPRKKSPLPMKGVVYNRSIWGDRGRFLAVHSDAMLSLHELGRVSYTVIVGDEMDFGGKRWFLDRATGKITIADMECGISTSRTLGNADALIMEVGCLKVLSLHIKPYDGPYPTGQSLYG